MLQYDWPGNVRELENCIARGVTLGNHATIGILDLPPAIQALRDSDSYDFASGVLSTAALSDMEKATILRVFDQVNGDKALAGKLLGISRATLYRKLKLYGIPLRPTGKSIEPVRVAS